MKVPKCFTCLLALSCSLSVFDQAPARSDLPDRQKPVSERQQDDTFLEKVSGVPGDIVALPFLALGKFVQVMDYSALVLRVSDVLTSEDEKRTVRPIFTPISGGGLIFKQEGLGEQNIGIRAAAAYGKRTRRDLLLAMRARDLFSSGVGLELAAAHFRLPDEDFFGIGNSSIRANETNYLLRENSLRFGFVARPEFGAYFSAGLRYRDVRIGAGRDPNNPQVQDIFVPSEIPGISGAETWSFFFNLYYDTRDATGHPISGGETFLQYEQVRQLSGSEFGYSKLTFDATQHVDLFYQRVLALRLNTVITDPFQGKSIPFYRLAGLGGPETLRGYRPVRFRDTDFLLASLEYRWRIQSFAAAFLFFEEGRVFSDLLNDFSVDNFKYSYGGGVRLMGGNGALVAVLELAKSREQLSFNFRLNAGLRRF